jgi:hypothetical protein
LLINEQKMNRQDKEKQVLQVSSNNNFSTLTKSRKMKRKEHKQQ